MPVWKFKDHEEARRHLDSGPVDSEYFRRLAALWELSGQMCRLQVRPGIQKFRTMEEAEQERKQWDLRPAAQIPPQRGKP